jgi:hypothetical protein
MNDPLVTIGYGLLAFIAVALPATVVLAIIERVQIRRRRNHKAVLEEVEEATTGAIAVIGQIAGRSVEVGTYGKRGRTNKSKTIAAVDDLLRKVDES